MRTQFGDAYAQSVAKDFVFDTLGGRTVDRALADGVDAKLVWRAVCDTFKVPENLRLPGQPRSQESRRPHPPRQQPRPGSRTRPRFRRQRHRRDRVKWSMGATLLE